jgi:citrate lyase subunit beta / citryl-CoA lyase
MRSLLFVPGDDERKLAKGLASAADALILDFEDSVAQKRKPAARKLCAEVLRKRTKFCMCASMRWIPNSPVKTCLLSLHRNLPASCCRNAVMVRMRERWMRCCRNWRRRLDFLLAPSAYCPSLQKPAHQCSASALMPNRRYRVCTDWGAEDLAADIGSLGKHDAQGHYTAPYQLARSLCLFGAAAASTIAIDAVYVDFRNLAGLRAEAEAGVRDGFSAKAAIHPDQVGPINEVFTPSQADVDAARHIVAAFDAQPGVGVVAMDGKMVDRPHYVAAQRVLARARKRLS